MLYFNAPTERSQTQVSPYAYHYLFETSSFYFLEIRNYGNGLTGHNYQWFMVQKADFKVSPLNLRFVDSSTIVEERYFDEGYLKFDHTSGTYIEKYNSAQHALVQIAAIAIPPAVHQAIANFMI